MTKSLGIVVLGSTGSIGVNTLDVVSQHPDQFHIVALSGYSRLDRLFEQCLQFRPQYVVLGHSSDVDAFALRLRNANVPTEVLSEQAGLETVAALDETDAVMAAIVGAAGLRSTLAAAKAGKRILLANKESLVIAGELLVKTVKASGATLLPVDSEHNAIFQSLPVAYKGNMAQHGVESLVLTASGGPFLHMDATLLKQVTPEQACKHPNWVMGKKISVDSASLMNKGLEVIEASWLFNVPASKIEVLIHPQSVIHSMVRYCDGSVLAQLGTPDMRTPIASALAWPERIQTSVEKLDFLRLSALTFEAPDLNRFPCLKLAYQAIDAGAAATTTLNAANEVAVQAFLERKIGFTAIHEVVHSALDLLPTFSQSCLEELLEIDANARDHAVRKIQSWSH